MSDSKHAPTTALSLGQLLKALDRFPTNADLVGASSGTPGATASA